MQMICKKVGVQLHTRLHQGWFKFDVNNKKEVLLAFLKFLNILSF